MTYMFEYPQFVRITVPENNLYPQYGLYAYSEGRLTERARKMWFEGIPVLFLPGNSGSHMQGRSLASVALRMALSDLNEYHFDFFMVSYNEDLSGLYGGLLQSETEFAAASISKILSLYKNNKYTKSVPTSIILIGHSMGGVVAKRLLAYPETLHTTNIAITLAAPLQAPIINFDLSTNYYYKLIESEWNYYVNGFEEFKQKKLLISFGGGVRDLLVPSGFTSSNDSDINALTTSVPGVWVSPDHVSIVWCKQLVLAITRFLFDIVNPDTEQVYTNKHLLMAKARQYFQANRSKTLNDGIPRATVNMLADAFWYEDNRRVYQISRPDIDKTTYLMIRLVSYPQNRFVAVESVNVEDKDWVFGCNANQVHGSHRYCKQATSLSELSRWTASPKELGKRKLATVHLHDIIEKHPDWTHVVVKVSPTNKPIVLNVDINDYASRRIDVQLPFEVFGSTVIKEETEPKSIYYELVLPGFDTINQAYLLYVEPSADCKASYHVSAELHVPWAANHEVFHYYSHLKQSPMKLRLFQSNPNVTLGMEPTRHATVTLLLDPQCTFKISISSSWYYRIAQLVRNYSPVLVPYVAAILLLGARSNIQHLSKYGTTISVHNALTSEGVKPYYVLVFSRLALVGVASIPVLTFVFDTAGWKNPEMRYFVRSLLVLPAYMTALGLINVAALGILGVMIFSSQLAHRLLFRIVWRGGSSVAERMSTVLQRLPLAVSAALLGAASLACGAAALAAGAAFYAFMLSKMYEEYLEDYVYKLMAKITARLCRMFRSKSENKDSDETNSNQQQVDTREVKAIENKTEEGTTKNETRELKAIEENETKDDTNNDNENSKLKIDTKPAVKDIINTQSEENSMLLTEIDDKSSKETEKNNGKRKSLKRVKSNEEIDEELNSINFHMMMFLLWLIVTLVNLPALLTWARNFKYSMALKPDSSYYTGLVMSACSSFIWQIEGPKKKLKYYEHVSTLLFTMAVLILTFGPFALYFVNYGVTFIFAVITIQQLFDKELTITEEEENEQNENREKDSTSNTEDFEKKENTRQQSSSESPHPSQEQKSRQESEEITSDVPQNDTTECDPCSESRIYSVFKNLRDKINFTENDN